MAHIDAKYLDELVERFRGYKSPTESQQLIILLGKKDNRSDDDNHRLAVLIENEEQAVQLADADISTQRKLVWANAMEAASKEDKEINALMSELRYKVYDRGYVSARDKDIVKADYEALTTEVNEVTSDNKSSLSNEFLNKPGNSI